MSENILDNLIPKVAARGLIDFRQKAFMPQIVNADYSAEAAQKGDHISVMVPSDLAVKDVVPGKDHVAPDASDVEVVNIELDHWKSVSFYLTDKELMQIDADEHFLPFQMTQAIGALAAEMNQSFLRIADYGSNVLGEANKPLFSNEDAHKGTVHGGVQVAIDARKMLNKRGAPKEGRYGIIGYEEEANATELAQFADAGQSGDSRVKLEGELGRKFGIDWISTDQIVKNRDNPVAETFRTTFTAKVGTNKVRAISIETEPKAGDLLIKSNGELVGVISSSEEKNANEYEMTLTSNLPKDLAANTTLKFGRPANKNVIFQRNAFAFATRPLAAATQHLSLGSRIIALTDPVSGLSLRLEIYRQHKQTVWEFDALWGVKMVRPEFAVTALSA